MMDCNQIDCYWHSGNKGENYHKIWEGTNYCLSDQLEEHYDENNNFELIPDIVECPGYWEY